jgi:hypothetical protein
MICRDIKIMGLDRSETKVSETEPLPSARIIRALQGPLWLKYTGAVAFVTLASAVVWALRHLLPRFLEESAQAC